MLDKVKSWLGRPWMDEREYRANILGMQIVIGAVLGFVLAGAEAFDARDFAGLLLLTFGGVGSILYISASRHRAFYAATSMVYALALPWAVLRITGVAAPDKLAPTLLIWTLFQAGVEFAPRKRDTA